MDRLLRMAQSRGLRLGLRGNPIWLVVGASAWMLLRARRPGQDVVYRTELAPGETLTVGTVPSANGPRRR